MNDELLLRQLKIVTSIADQGSRLRAAMSTVEHDTAANALNAILTAVDALRDTVRAQPYYPAMGESVTVQGTVTEVGVYGHLTKIEFGEGPADYISVDPSKVSVRPL